MIWLSVVALAQSPGRPPAQASGLPDLQKVTLVLDQVIPFERGKPWKGVEGPEGWWLGPVVAGARAGAACDDRAVGFDSEAAGRSVPTYCLPASETSLVPLKEFDQHYALILPEPLLVGGPDDSPSRFQLRALHLEGQLYGLRKLWGDSFFYNAEQFRMPCTWGTSGDLSDLRADFWRSEEEAPKPSWGHGLDWSQLSGRGVVVGSFQYDKARCQVVWRNGVYKLEDPKSREDCLIERGPDDARATLRLFELANVQDVSEGASASQELLEQMCSEASSTPGTHAILIESPLVFPDPPAKSVSSAGGGGGGVLALLEGSIPAIVVLALLIVAMSLGALGYIRRESVHRRWSQLTAAFSSIGRRTADVRPPSAQDDAAQRSWNALEVEERSVLREIASPNASPVKLDQDFEVAMCQVPEAERGLSWQKDKTFQGLPTAVLATRVMATMMAGRGTLEPSVRHTLAILAKTLLDTNDYEPFELYQQSYDAARHPVQLFAQAIVARYDLGDGAAPAVAPPAMAPSPPEHVESAEVVPRASEPPAAVSPHPSELVGKVRDQQRRISDLVRRVQGVEDDNQSLREQIANLEQRLLEREEGLRRDLDSARGELQSLRARQEEDETRRRSAAQRLEHAVTHPDATYLKTCFEQARNLRVLGDTLTRLARAWNDHGSKSVREVVETSIELREAAQTAAPDAYLRWWKTREDRLREVESQMEAFVKGIEVLDSGANVDAAFKSLLELPAYQVADSHSEISDAIGLRTWRRFVELDDTLQRDDGRSLAADVARQIVERVVRPWLELGQFVWEALPRELRSLGGLIQQKRLTSRKIEEDVASVAEPLGYVYEHVELYRNTSSEYGSRHDSITVEPLPDDAYLFGLEPPSQVLPSAIVRVKTPVFVDHPKGQKIVAHLWVSERR